MTPAAAEQFGYCLHNFPNCDGFYGEDDELMAMYSQAAAGRLPTARRAEIQAQMYAP
jgi:hypothetical protein